MVEVSYRSIDARLQAFVPLLVVLTRREAFTLVRHFAQIGEPAAARTAARIQTALDAAARRTYRRDTCD